MAAFMASARPFARATPFGMNRSRAVRTFASSTPATTKEGAKAMIEEINSSNKVVVWSKTYCPYCSKAKAAMGTLLKPSDFLVIEIEGRKDMDLIQDVMGEMTGARSVPRVFVANQFIGGGDDTARKASNGELATMLKAEGLSVLA